MIVNHPYLASQMISDRIGQREAAAAAVRTARLVRSRRRRLGRPSQLECLLDGEPATLLRGAGDIVS
jgi:hypothetical protein